MLLLGLGSVDVPCEGCWTAEDGDLGLQGWWLPAASQRLSDHDAFDAPLQPGWLVRLCTAWQVPGATWDPLHGLSTLPAHQDASLGAQLKGLTFSAASAHRSQG